jgi:hypothetical protein
MQANIARTIEESAGLNIPRVRIFAAAVLIALFGFVLPANASVVLEVNGSGILTGAKNVDVNGTLYDVTFADGTCVDLFGGCTSSSDFAFNTEGDADAAATALENQVLLDTVSGNFDSTPALTFGCSFTSCESFIPFAVGGDYVEYDWFDNFSTDSSDNVAGPAGNLKTADSSGSTTPGSASNWAIFAPASTPIPSTLPLMATGVVGLGLLRRWQVKKKKYAAMRQRGRGSHIAWAGTV